VIVRLIASSDNKVHAAAADALGSLNSHGRHWRLSLEANALPPLVRLLSSSDVKVLENACSALMHLCYPPENGAENLAASAALSAGAVPPLIYLLWHEDSLRTTAAVALAHVCTHGPAQAAALKLNAIPALMHLLTSLDTHKDLAFPALANINILPDANMVSVKANAIPLLVNFISSSKFHLVTYACEALRNICIREHDAQVAAFSAGAIPPLIRLVLHDDSSVRPSPRYVGSVQAAAIGALANICSYGPARAVALNLNVIRTLEKQLLSSEFADVKQAAALALEKIR